MRKTIQTVAAIATGTIGINVGVMPVVGSSPFTHVRVNGTIVLTGNFNITPTGTPKKNTLVEIEWEAAVTPSSGKDVIIFGKTVPQDLLNLAGPNAQFIAKCLYDGTGWQVKILVDFSTAGIIGTTSLKADAVEEANIRAKAVTLAKLANGTTAHFITYDALGVPKSTLISSDILIDESGVATIQALTVVDAMIFDLDASKLTGTLAPALFADRAIPSDKLTDIVLINALYAQQSTPASLVETDLWTNTLPANFLANDGEAVRITAYGEFAPTANVKALTIKYDGNDIVDNAVTTAPNGLAWKIEATIMRSGATGSVAKGEILMEGIAAAFDGNKANVTWANPVIFNITGQESSGVGNEILINQVVFERIR